MSCIIPISDSAADSAAQPLVPSPAEAVASAFDEMSAAELATATPSDSGDSAWGGARPLYIGVSGNIAAGKTTLVKALATALGMDVALEPVKTNPFLPLFYADRSAYAFPLQLWFLINRYSQNARIRFSDRPVIQDRTAFEDHIFATTLYEAHLMTEPSYRLYQSTFKILSAAFQRPDLYIYLDVDPAVSLERVHRRMESDPLRRCESTIDLEYLTRLKSHYDRWIAAESEHGPVLRLNWNHPLSVEETVDAARSALAARHVYP